MDFAEFTLVITNLIIGFGFAIPVALHLGKTWNKPNRVFRYFALLIGIYLLECVAVVAAMGIPVFSVGLAFVWGIIFGFWFRAHESARRALRASFFLSLYTSLPAASFIVLSVLIWASGRHILNSEEGIRFGIPDFFPWPLNTILGFYTACSIGAVVFKTTITTGEVSLLLHLKQKSGDEKIRGSFGISKKA